MSRRYANDTCTGLYEDDAGEYVDYSAYDTALEREARLRAQNAALRAALADAWDALTDLNQAENDDGELSRRIESALSQSQG